jgi:hypothetical protein
MHHTQTIWFGKTAEGRLAMEPVGTFEARVEATVNLIATLLAQTDLF